MEWKDTVYNIGNYFDGTYFTVPTAGLYSFHVSCRHTKNSGIIYLYKNNLMSSQARRESSSGDFGVVDIQTTLKLAENDKIDVRIAYNLYDTNEATTTYFEGRLIARLE